MIDMETSMVILQDLLKIIMILGSLTFDFEIFAAGGKQSGFSAPDNLTFDSKVIFGQLQIFLQAA